MELGCQSVSCTDENSGGDRISGDRALVDSSQKRCLSSSIGKNKSPRWSGQSPTLSASSKLTSHKKLSNRRKSPPLNWFPRQKVASYLQRKIQMLQEVEGMNSTLDETLGDSNLHYSKVLREKIAAKEAASKAMEARKAAMVEASWCRILQAARIQSKEADSMLEIAEKAATEAFEVASAMGVIIYDKQNFSKKHCQVEDSSVDSGALTKHTVAASFETAFEVDKEVASAVKTAIVTLANSQSSDKERLRNLLMKFSVNPNTVEDNEMIESSAAPDGESQVGIAQQQEDGDNKVAKLSVPKMRQNKSGKRKSLEKLNKIKLVDTMLHRLESLEEEELCSLATIVSTCGLSAALAEVEDNCSDGTITNGSLHFQRRMSPSIAGTDNSHLPSLDKFLVKHISKLEREVQGAKNLKNATIKGEAEKSIHANGNCGESATLLEASDLGSILVKHSSKLEREIKEAKRNAEKDYGNSCSKPGKSLQDSSQDIPSLGSILVKHLSKLEREVQQAKKNTAERTESEFENARTRQDRMQDGQPLVGKFVLGGIGDVVEKENIDSNKEGIMKRKIGKNVVKSGNINPGQEDSLEMVLLKGVNLKENKDDLMVTKCNESPEKILASVINDQVKKQVGEGGLEQILVKHKSKREQAKTTAEGQEFDFARPSMSRREAREKELQEQWGGLGLGSFRPHLSKLEREKAAWIKAEEEERRTSRQT